MKFVLAATLAVSMLTAGAASARPIFHHHPHKVCTMRHHHRVCRWVR